MNCIRGLMGRGLADNLSLTRYPSEETGRITNL
jgi:hypothetical protein